MSKKQKVQRLKSSELCCGELRLWLSMRNSQFSKKTSTPLSLRGCSCRVNTYSVCKVPWDDYIVIWHFINKADLTWHVLQTWCAVLGLPPWGLLFGLWIVGVNSHHVWWSSQRLWHCAASVWESRNHKSEDQWSQKCVWHRCCWWSSEVTWNTHKKLFPASATAHNFVGLVCEQHEQSQKSLILFWYVYLWGCHVISWVSIKIYRKFLQNF